MFTTNSGRFISYYGREHTLDIQRQDRNNSTIGTIDQLFNVLLNVWCKETAYPSCQKDYDYDNDPTYGQCAITATLVYNLFGGTIHKLKVDGGGTHYFNKINDHYEEFIGNRQYKTGCSIPLSMHFSLHCFAIMVQMLSFRHWLKMTGMKT